MCFCTPSCTQYAVRCTPSSPSPVIAPLCWKLNLYCLLVTCLGSTSSVLLAEDAKYSKLLAAHHADDLSYQEEETDTSEYNSRNSHPCSSHQSTHPLFLVVGSEGCWRNLEEPGYSILRCRSPRWFPDWAVSQDAIFTWMYGDAMQGCSMRNAKRRKKRRLAKYCGENADIARRKKYCIYIYVNSELSTAWEFYTISIDEQLISFETIGYIYLLFIY